jgi:hypothetical protein
MYTLCNLQISPQLLLEIKFVTDIAAGWWFSPGTPVSSTNKTDRHDKTEILLKVALNTTHTTKTTLFIFFSIYIRGQNLEH